MAATHGVANALGFVLCTLLGLRLLPSAPEPTGLTYAEVGATQAGPLPDGYRHLRVRHLLMPGATAHDLAAVGDALLRWQVHEAALVEVFPDGPEAVPGVRVVSRPGVGPVHLSVPCEVVWVERGADRIGFGYGTLPGHLFRGEEAFTVERDDAGDLWFVVTAFSVPDRWWVRLAGPLTVVGQRLYLRVLARGARRMAGVRQLRCGVSLSVRGPGAIAALCLRCLVVLAVVNVVGLGIVGCGHGAGADRVGPDGRPRRTSRTPLLVAVVPIAAGRVPRRTAHGAPAGRRDAASGSTSWCSRWSARSCRSRSARRGACSASSAGRGSSPPPRGPSEPAARGGGPGARTPVGSAGRTRRERRCHGEGLGREHRHPPRPARPARHPSRRARRRGRGRRRRRRSSGSARPTGCPGVGRARAERRRRSCPAWSTCTATGAAARASRTRSTRPTRSVRSTSTAGTARRAWSRRWSRPRRRSCWSAPRCSRSWRTRARSSASTSRGRSCRRTGAARRTPRTCSTATRTWSAASPRRPAAISSP